MAIDRAAALRNAEKLLRQGRLDQAIAEYVRIVDEQPADWNTRNALGDLYVRAGDGDRAAAEYTRIADAFKHEGFYSKAGALYRKVLKIKPGDEHALLQGAEVAIAQGLLADARSGYATVIERRRGQGDAAGAEALGRRLVTSLLGHNAIEEARPLVMAQVDEACARDDWAAAAAALDALLVQAPQDVPSLARLVEIAVDGSLDARLAAAQARLADAYVERGSASEARYIAQDLLIRDPENVAHIDRLRRVLVALGEPNVDAAIAECRGRPLAVDGLVAPPPAPPPSLPAATVTAPPEPPEAAAPSWSPAPVVAPVSAEQAMVAAAGGELGREVIIAQVQHRSTKVEIDLSVVLDQIHIPPTAAPTLELDDVFAQMRDEVRRRQEIDQAEQEYRRGIAFFQAGQLDDSVSALESAAKTPRFRFEAASLLGRIFLNRGDLPRAIAWLDRAAEAPAPSPAEHHKVLYNLVDALESAGDAVRALAVSLELQSSAGDFRDLAARIRRLAQAQARG